MFEYSAAARLEPEIELQRGRDELADGDHEARVAKDGAPSRLELHVVRDPARVVEEVADPNAPPLPNPARQVLLDGVVEAQPAFGNELHHGDRDEGLGDAADPGSIGRLRLAVPLDVGEPAGRDVPDAVLFEGGDDGRHVAPGDELVRGPLKLALGGRRGCRLKDGDVGNDRGEEGKPSSAHTTSTR